MAEATGAEASGVVKTTVDLLVVAGHVSHMPITVSFHVSDGAGHSTSEQTSCKCSSKARCVPPAITARTKLAFTATRLAFVFVHTCTHTGSKAVNVRRTAQIAARELFVPLNRRLAQESAALSTTLRMVQVCC